MSYQVLARKWRPRNFEQMVGQTHVARALVNALDSERIHHAYLFTGTRGVGKTTLARIVAKCLNCEQGVSSRPCGSCSACTEIDEGRFVDLIEVDAASRAKVEETRDLMDNVQFSPARGRYKVYIIDEVHMFSAHSFNALLKTLEEPPPHVKFLLATTDPQKLPVTVLSRCLQFNLRRLPIAQIAGRLDEVAKREGMACEPGATRLIAQAADGSLRDALSLLDQAVAYSGGALGVAHVRDMLGTLDRDQAMEIVRALAESDGVGIMARVREMAAQAVDCASALQEILSVLHRVAVLQVVPDAQDAQASDGADALGHLASALGAEDVQLMYQIGLMGARDLPFAPDPVSGLEMILLRMLAFRPVLDSPRGAGGAPGASPGAASDKADATPVPRVETEASPPSGPVPGGASLTAQAWPGVLESLQVNGLVRELAANAVPRCFANGQLALVLSRGHAHLKTENLIEQLAAALSRLHGERVKVSVSIEEPDTETPAEREERARGVRREAAVRDMENDPNVHAMCETFEAVLDRESIRLRDVIDGT